MSQLIQLRRHIKSIQTTKKITYAMRLISMSLYSKLEKLNKSLTYHQKCLHEIFANLNASSENFCHPILHPDDILDTNPLIIVASSTKGLCGSFNSNLFRYFKRYFFIQEHQVATFITVGSKANDFIKEENLGKILRNFDDFNSNNFLAIAEQITNIICANNFSSIVVYSNIFKGFFLQKPQCSTITPFEKSSLKMELDGKDKDFYNLDITILEQNLEEITSYLAVSYIRTYITKLLFQSLLSEYCARFIAMDHATTNAENFLEKLTLQYNKSRQALITKELSELSASYG